MRMKMKKYFKLSLLFFLLATTLRGFSQDSVMLLYPKGQIPNSRKSTEKEIVKITDGLRIENVQVPDLAVFLPSQRYRTGESVIICPGGGYHLLSYSLEGTDVARFWNSKGVAAFVLKYRLPSERSQTEPYKVPLLDAQRAMRLVRYYAEEWGLNPDKIGIMGFSAGGHLAATLSTHYDQGNPEAKDPVERVSCRPDFSILVYPVISCMPEFDENNYKRLFVGNDNKDLIRYFSNEFQVTPDTPPAVMIQSANDSSVSVENSIAYFRALKKNGVKRSALFFYPYGQHGFGLAIKKGFLSTWPEQAYEWMKALDYKDDE